MTESKWGNRKGPSSSPNAAISPPNSDCSSFRFQGREECLRADGSREHTKILRTLDNDAVGSNRPHQGHSSQSTGKTLHGIDYIAHMPSPSDEQVSLPPLKSRQNGLGIDAIPPPPPPHSSTSDPTETCSPGKNNVAPSNPIIASTCRANQPTPMPNGLSSETKTDTTTQNTQKAISTPTKPLLQPFAFRESLAPNQYVAPRSTSPSNSTAIFPPPSQQQQQQQLPPPPAEPTSSNPTPSSSPSISSLESRLDRLKHYASELLSLSLHDSHVLLQHEIQRQENALVQLLAKRERSQRLVRRMEEEFPEMVDVCREVKREGGKLGYF